MSGRRERVTITAHAPTDGRAPDVTVEGRLLSFLVETREEYDVHLHRNSGYEIDPKTGEVGRKLPGASLERKEADVTVTIVMKLDPESARVFRDRNRPRPQPTRPALNLGVRNSAFSAGVASRDVPSAKLLPSQLDRVRRAVRIVQLIAVDADWRTIMQATGMIPWQNQIAATSSVEFQWQCQRCGATHRSTITHCPCAADD